MHVRSYFILHIDFVCSFCQQCCCQGLLESLSLVMVVINKTPILKVCCALKIFLGISIDYWCFPDQLISICSLQGVMTWIGCAQNKKIRTENTALWLKSVFFRLKFYFFKITTYATCKPQFIHNESGCSYSKLIFRSFPEDFTGLTSRLYTNCEIQKSPQFGGDMCSCLTAFKSDAQTKLHQTESREDLF